MTRGEGFMKKGKRKSKHCSSISSSAFCDLNSKRHILKLHDKCRNLKCKCQRIITFTHQYMLEGGSIKSNSKSIFRGTKKACDSFMKPRLKMATPLISAAAAVKKRVLNHLK